MRESHGCDSKEAKLERASSLEARSVLRVRRARLYARWWGLPPLASHGRLRGTPLAGFLDVVAGLGVRSVGGTVPGRPQSFAFGIHGEILNRGSRSIYAS